MDATQTAYLWTHRHCYGARAAALRALRRRRSAAGASVADCEHALECGLAILAKTAELMAVGPPLHTLPDADLRRRVDDWARQVLAAVPGSTSEMVSYALGMLVWLPLLR